jgi:hypothetical protein
MKMEIKQNLQTRILSIILTVALVLSVGAGLTPIKSYAATYNTNIAITSPEAATGLSISATDPLSINFNITANSHIETNVYLQELQNGAWIKSEYASSKFVYDSNYDDGGDHLTSGTVTASYPVTGGEHVFRLSCEGDIASTPEIKVTVAKVSPKLSVSNLTITPAYTAGKGTIKADYALSGYNDTTEANWVLEQKKGSSWKAVGSYIYAYSHTFNTKESKIGSAVTYRLRYKGDAYANGASTEFKLFQKKITATVTGKTVFKSNKAVNLTVKLSQKTSGALTVYFKGKSLGTMTFANKKTVKVPMTFWGNGKDKLYVKYTPADKKYKNATSKKVTVTVKR